MKKTVFIFSLFAFLVLGAHGASATAGKCCAALTGNSSSGGNTASSCCAEPDAANGSICASGQTEVDCSTVSSCPTSSSASTTCTAAPAAAAASSAADQAPAKAEFPIILPKIPLNIPTISLPEFANVTQKDGYIYIPFISVFLVGAYKIGVGIASVLAVIVIMAGGMVWIAAAGDAGRIGKAKTMISGAVTGLVLTLGSYVALSTVNPNLVNFTALKIKTVDQRTVDVLNDTDYEVTGNPDMPMSTANPSQYDPIFQKYAPCAGVTRDALKAIAQAESGLNPNAGNGSYSGFFQLSKGLCPANCTDPDANTAVAARLIKASVDKIKSKCPSLPSPHDQMVMIYIGHNNGPGVLNKVIQNGCDESKMQQTLNNYYANDPNGQATALKYTTKNAPGIACIGDKTDAQSRADCTSGPKFAFTDRLANKAASVSQVISNSSTGSCPN